MGDIEVRTGSTMFHRKMKVRVLVLPYAGLTEGSMSGTFVKFLEKPIGYDYEIGDTAEITTHFLAPLPTADEA